MAADDVGITEVMDLIQAPVEQLVIDHIEALHHFLNVNQRLHEHIAYAGTASWASKTANAPAPLDHDIAPPSQAPASLPGVIGEDDQTEIKTWVSAPLSQGASRPSPHPPAAASQRAVAPDPVFAPIMPEADAGMGVFPDSNRRHSDGVKHPMNPVGEAVHPSGSSVSCGGDEMWHFLERVPLFKRIHGDRETLCECCEEVKFSKGNIILRQGDVGTEFFLLMRGRVGVLVDGVRNAGLLAGDYFGEAALIRNEPLAATIKADTDVACLRITQENFKKLGLADKVLATDVGAEEHQTAVKDHKAVFADAAAMKEKLRVAMAKPPYDVRNFYHETGFPQKVARSSLFENTTLGVIAFNAMWIAVDTDHNNAEMLVEADPVFIVAENFFCLYFTMEWLFRFLSFKYKRNGLKDGWFVFDSCLVFTMISETWILNALALMAGGADSVGIGNASILRLFRLFRLSRLARMARLLRAMPELLVLIKGMAVALRSVGFTLLLLGFIIYVFAIVFVQLLKDTDAGDDYFPKVHVAMNALLLDGVLPDQAALVNDVGDEGWVYRVIIMVYILLSALTVMNMLVGVLCEVVSVVSSVEKESLLVNYVKGTLLHMLQTSGLDADGDQLLTKHEFEALLQNATAAKALTEVGVDVIGLVDFTDFIFKDGRALSFPDFMELVLQLRGSNLATVKDLVDLRKMMVNEFEKFGARQHDILEDMVIDFEKRIVPENQLNVNYMATGMLQQGQGSAGGGGGMPKLGQIKDLQIQGLSWAAAASMRLSAAATELSAAAGELSTRRKPALDDVPTTRLN
jgi:CRP-like cAMP-binding protein